MRKKCVFVKGQVSQLHLKFSALSQVCNFKGHGVFQIVMFLKLSEFGIRRFFLVYHQTMSFQIAVTVKKPQFGKCHVLRNYILGTVPKPLNATFAN